jgi:hypothetical protein
MTGVGAQVMKNIVTVGSVIRLIDGFTSLTHTVADIYVIGSAANISEFSVSFRVRIWFSFSPLIRESRCDENAFSG